MVAYHLACETVDKAVCTRRTVVGVGKLEEHALLEVVSPYASRLELLEHADEAVERFGGDVDVFLECQFVDKGFVGLCKVSAFVERTDDVGHGGLFLLVEREFTDLLQQAVVACTTVVADFHGRFVAVVLPCGKTLADIVVVALAHVLGNLVDGDEVAVVLLAGVAVADGEILVAAVVAE